ncbi:MAG: adenine deaminase [Lachnospiraceae bacterium]|jgi:adenine deaminase|nr:adenine deaminase [Lachnospiraceae bacterium]
MSLEKSDELKELIAAARGTEKADLVLKNGKFLNIFTGELEEKDVAIRNGYIAGIGSYEGNEEIDLEGKILCPGLIDGHIHLESSMLSPTEFAKAVLPHGTTALVTDPHEIANVAGAEGLSYMLESTEELPIEIFFMLPSCVPATPLDEAGAELNAASLNSFYANQRVLGLAELMNSYGTVCCDTEIISKILGAQDHDRLIDGHAPGLTGQSLNAYIAAGVESDHECSTAEEAIEKLKRGQWIMIREGTAAKNLKALLPLFDDEYCNRCMLVTDDKHPGELIRHGHIDHIIREAVKAGKKPANAIKMASFNTATYFGLKKRGAIAPGYRADLIVVSNLEEFQIEKVFKKGILAVDNGEICIEVPTFEKKEEKYPRVHHSFHCPELKASDFVMEGKGSKKRVIEVLPGELLTREVIVPANLERWKEQADNGHLPSAPGVELDKDIIKVAVIERHKQTGHVGVGFATGYGIQYGAIASSVAHDSHNLIVAGTNDTDMAVAANAVRENEGGLAIAVDGKVLSSLALPIGGLMCNREASYVEDKLEEMKSQARLLGVPEGIDPFMTLAFVALPVIPKLRVSTRGLVDVDTQTIVPAVFD